MEETVVHRRCIATAHIERDLSFVVTQGRVVGRQLLGGCASRR